MGKPENTEIENFENLETIEDAGDEVVELNKFETELKLKYTKVYAVEVELESAEFEKTLYFKKPSTLSFNRVLKTASKKSLQAMKTFTIESIVDEQLEEYKELIEDYPALAGSVGGKLLELLGATDNISIKKL